MKKFIVILILLVATFSYGQYLPRNPKVGMCYLACFDYQAKFEWKEVSCDSLKKNNIQEGYFEIKGEEAVNLIKRQTKFKAYQAKLIKLGYDLEATGKTDEKTIIAHHQYLKDKKKAAKKEVKRLKKAKKDSLKQIKLQSKHSQKGL